MGLGFVSRVYSLRCFSMLSALFLVGCSFLKQVPGEEYAKPRIMCEAGCNKGQGNEKSDCWFVGEIGTTIKLEGE